MYDLGPRLKALRQQQGLTQKQLADRLNKSVSAISSYESNRQQPPLDVIASICNIFSISADSFLGIDTNDYLSLNHLSEEQKQLMHLIVQELTSPTATGAFPSQEQMKIIGLLLHLFSSH